MSNLAICLHNLAKSKMKFFSINDLHVFPEI
ncbi:MAG: hypothetical protein K0S28_1608 [Paucimonas sp.]|jgi:hypothetical protein|nr:hypothetical protein [Paucimonas sp.]